MLFKQNNEEIYELGPKERKPLTFNTKNLTNKMSFSTINHSWSGSFPLTPLGIYHFELKTPNNTKSFFKIETLLENSLIYITLIQVLPSEEPYFLSNETLYYTMLYQQKGLTNDLYKTLKPGDHCYYTPERPDLEQALSLLFVRKGAQNQQVLLEANLDLDRYYQNQEVCKGVFCLCEIKENNKKLIFRTENKQNIGNSIGFTIIFEVRIPSIGLSWIYNSGIKKQPFELAYFLLIRPEFYVLETYKARQAQFRLEDLQIENNGPSRVHFPLVLTRKGSQVFFNMLLEQQKLENNDKLLLLTSFKLDIDEIQLNLEKSFLNLCGDYYKEIRSIFIKTPLEPHYHPLLLHSPWQNLNPKPVTKNLFINQLEISPISLTISYKSLSSDQTSSLTLKNWYKSLHNIDNANLKLPGLILQNYFDNKGDLLLKLRHRLKESLGFSFKLLGSVEILGNPVGLFNHFSTGVWDLFEKPMEGFIAKGPLEGGKGLITGVSSFMRNTLTGTFNSVDKISSSFGTGLATLSFDMEYLKKRGGASNNNKAGNVVQGIGQASVCLYKGFENGITGVFLKPLEGAKEEGIPGLLKGTFKGMAGLFFKPIAAILDATSKTAEGIKNSVILGKNRVNTRYRRPFYGVEKYYREYSQEDGEMVEFLGKFKKGRFSNMCLTDFVTLKEEEGKDMKFLVIMIESLLMLSLKKKKKEWEIRTNGIRRVERYKDGIAIELKEKNKRIEGERVRIEIRDGDLKDYVYRSLCRAIDINKTL